MERLVPPCLYFQEEWVQPTELKNVKTHCTIKVSNDLQTSAMFYSIQEEGLVISERVKSDHLNSLMLHKLLFWIFHWSLQLPLTFITKLNHSRQSQAGNFFCTDGSAACTFPHVKQFMLRLHSMDCQSIFWFIARSPITAYNFFNQKPLRD